MSNIDSTYSKKLKEKVTIQAKRLNKLEAEKEELIELLREKQISSDSSQISSIISNSKPLSKYIPIQPISQLYQNELDQYKHELFKANAMINELQQNKIEMNVFKEQITERLTQTTIDIEKTKKSLTDLQTERDGLNDKVSNLEELNCQNMKIIKEKDDLLFSIESSLLKSLRDEKSELLNQIKRYEASSSNLKKENRELAIKLTDLDKNKQVYNNAITETIELKKSKTKNYKEIRNLNEKNKKLYKGNKELTNQLITLRNENSELNRLITELKLSNGGVAQTIEGLTDKIDKFQEKVEKNISKTLKMNSNIEIEQKQKEFIKVLSTKDEEINKLKELNKNYALLENELTNAIKEKDSQSNKIKVKYDKLILTYKTAINELTQAKSKISQLINETDSFKNEIGKLKETYEQMSMQLQSNARMKTMQINNLKNINQMLEDKILVQEKTKNYFQHLLLKTHPNSSIVQDILDLYFEIIDLEKQKREIELDIMNKGNANEYQNDIWNIDQQMNLLKVNLSNLEREIYVTNI